MADKSSKELTKRLPIDSDEYILRKRLPKHLPKRKNDFYINSNTDFGIQLKICQKVLESKQFDDIVIHGLGKAVNKAINLSLQLKESYNLNISCNTSSVELIDDLEPIGHNRDFNESFTQRRTVSAIHIKLFNIQNKTN